LKKKLDEMDELIMKIAHSLNNLYAKSIREFESMDPSVHDHYPDELDPVDIATKLKSLNDSMALKIFSPAL